MNRRRRMTLALAICFAWASQAVAQDEIVQLNKNGQLVPPSNLNAKGDKGKPRQISKKKSKPKATGKKDSGTKTTPSKSKGKRTLKKQSPKKSTAATASKSKPTAISPEKTTAATASKSKPKVISPQKTTAATAGKSKPVTKSVTLKRLRPSDIPNFKPRFVNPKIDLIVPAPKTTAATASKSKPTAISPQKTTAATASKSKPKVISPQKTTAATASKSKPKVISPQKTTAATASKSKPKVISPQKTTAATASKSKPKVISPQKTTAATASKSKPKSIKPVPKTGLSTRTKAVAGLGLVAGGAGVYAIAKDSKAETKNNLDALRRGDMTKTDFAKKSTAKLAESSAAIYKLKKLSPTTLLLGDTIGTDPLDLAVKGVGDLLNGTDNAKQSVEGMKTAWNDSLVKETFTDPKSAAIRVGNDLKNTAEGVQNVAKGIGNTIDKGFDELQQSKFGQSKVGGALTEGVQTVWNVSPHKKLIADTKGTVQQAARGIDKGFKTVKSKTQEIAGGAKAKVNEVKTSASKTINKAKTGVTKATNKVKGFVGGLFKKK